MYLSTPRRIFQTIFGNVRKFTFFHILHGHNYIVCLGKIIFVK